MNKWKKRGIAVLLGVAMAFVFSALGWAEINQEGVIVKLTHIELTYPDIIDPYGVGWTIINITRDGIPTQIAIKTPFYKQPDDPLTEEVRKIRRLLE